MSLIEELLITVVADTSGVDRSVDESKKKTEDLTEKLRDTEKQSEKSGTALATFAAKALGALTAAFAVGDTISRAIERAGEIKQLAQTADSLGVAIDSLDAFGKAAEQAGGDAEGARDSLTDMAEKIGEAFSDSESGAAKAFKALGISIKDADGKAKDALTGFLDLADAVSGLDKSTAVFKIKELGITDNKSVELILKGRKEIERMIAVQKQQGVVSKESAERAIKLTDTITALKGSFASAGNGILDRLIPALTKVFEWLKIVVDWTSEHKDLVVGFFIAIGAVIGTVYLPAMIAAAAATIAATWPLIAIGAVIGVVAGAFALLYDDIMNFIDGNDSFIGQIFEKYPMVKEIVMTLIAGFKQMWDILTTGAKQVGGFVVAAFLQIYNGIKFAIDYLVQAMGGVRGFVDGSITAFNGLANVVKSIFAGIVDTVKSSIAFVTDSIAKVKSVASAAAGFLHIGGEDQPAANENQPARPSGSGQGPEDVPMVAPPAGAGVGQALNMANQQIGTASSTPANAFTSSAISNTTSRSVENNLQTGDITIQTQATDAQGISQGLGSELRDQLKNLNQETSTGVER